MAQYHTNFDDMNFSGVKHHRTKDVLKEGGINDGKGYCGVVHVHNIQWYNQFWMEKTDVGLYGTPFEETNVLSKKTGSTDHRVLMEGLLLWKKFERLKLRA